MTTQTIISAPCEIESPFREFSGLYPSSSEISLNLISKLKELGVQSQNQSWSTVSIDNYRGIVQIKVEFSDLQEDLYEIFAEQFANSN